MNFERGIIVPKYGGWSAAGRNRSRAEKCLNNRDTQGKPHLMFQI